MQYITGKHRGLNNLNTMTKKVSIVIPCYNQSQWVGEAITSCLNQTVKPIEIIVVDDGSTISLDKEIKFYHNKDIPVILLSKKNGGLSSARNAGIKIAKGEYILTLDSDDKIASNFLERCLEINDDVVSTGLREFGNSENYWYPYPEHPKFSDFIMNNCINCCSLFKREIWNLVGGFDEEMKLGYEDWDFWIRVAQKGYTFTSTREILFFYRKHGDSMVTGARKNHSEIRSYMALKY